MIDQGPARGTSIDTRRNVWQLAGRGRATVCNSQMRETRETGPTPNSQQVVVLLLLLRCYGTAWADGG